LQYEFIDCFSYHFAEREELGWEEDMEDAGREDLEVAGWEERSDGG
jgi:hypothetical protein